MMTAPAHDQVEWANAHDAGDCGDGCPHPDHQYEYRASLLVCPDSPTHLRDLWECITGLAWEGVAYDEPVML